MMTNRDLEENEGPSLREGDDGGTHQEAVVHVERILYPQNEGLEATGPPLVASSDTDKKLTSATSHEDSASASTNSHGKDVSRKQQKRKSPHVLVPGPADILAGRGKPYQSHSGNQHMLALVDDLRAEYLTTSKRGKHALIEHVMSSIRGRGGRFLDRSKDDQYWKEVKQSISYRKVGHAFRSKARRGSEILAQEERVGMDIHSLTRAESDELISSPSEPRQRDSSTMGNQSTGFTASAVAAASRAVNEPAVPVSRSIRRGPRGIGRGSSRSGTPVVRSPVALGGGDSSPLSFSSPHASGVTLDGGISSYLRQQQQHTMFDNLVAEHRLNAQRELFRQQQLQQAADLMSGGRRLSLPMLQNPNQLRVPPAGMQFQPPTLMAMCNMMPLPQMTFLPGAVGPSPYSMMGLPNQGNVGSSIANDPALELLLLERRMVQQEEQHMLALLAQRRQELYRQLQQQPPPRGDGL